jgi:non-specific serine/threonine protein kinase
MTFTSTLPARRRPLIGRERELDAVRDRLLHGDRRLVTLIGAGGTGKTTLALEVARRLGPHLSDGAWFVDLAVLKSAAAEDIALICAEALGMVDHGRSPVDALADHLAARQALLLLDNCEHVAAALATLVDGLLDRCPDLRILATSRAALRLADESVYPVPPFVPPSPDADPSPEQLAENVAARLFLERVAAVDPDFRLSAESAAAVASICRRMDGIPLAIELAAVMAATLTPKEIDEQLAAEGSLNVGSGRGPERQRTLEATIDWSYQLLDPAARTLFGRLASFAGGWSLEAAAHVGAPAAGSASVIDPLARLVEHSLVIREDLGARSRYRMLAPIADYAAERLAASGEESAASMAHLTYFLEFSKSPHASVAQCLPEDLDRLATEHDNCLAAIRFAERAGVLRLQLGLMLNLIMLWRVRGHLHLAVRHLEFALGQLGDGSHERAVILGVLAEFDNVLGAYDQAETRAREAEARFAAIGDRAGERSMMAQLGMVAAGRGDYVRAIAEFERAQPLLQALPDEVAWGYWHAGLGRFHLALGQLERAERHLASARERFEASPTWYIGRVLAMLGSVARLRGDLGPASSLLAAGLDSLRRYGATVDAIGCLEEMARVAIDQREPRTAATLFAAATGVRDATSVASSAPERRQRHMGIELVRARLAPDAFDGAWSRGLGMSLEQAAYVAAHGSESNRRQRAAPRGTALTAREREIAALVTLGLTNREIADRLVISPGTVKIHVERILGKLGRTSRVQIATWALEQRDRHTHGQRTVLD